jgi:hypothetical protein
MLRRPYPPGALRPALDDDRIRRVLRRAGSRSDVGVDVPADAYHRVSRALTAAWRDRWNLLSEPGRRPAAEHAARAVWRIAVLIGGRCREDGIAVRVRTRQGLATLTAAAEPLGLRLATASPRRGSTIVLADRGQSLCLRDDWLPVGDRSPR